MKRWSWRSIAVIAIIIVVAIVICRHIKTCEARENECISNPAVSGESNKPAPPIEVIQPCRESQSYFCRVVAPANFPNILLVLAGFLGIAAAFSTLKILERQTKATEDAVKIAAETKRPILVTYSFQMRASPVENAEAAVQYPRVHIAVKNYGREPGFLISGSVDFAIEDLPTEPIYKNQLGYQDTVVESGQPQNIGVHSPKGGFIPPDDISRILQNSKRLWVYGFVLYRDYFGAEHTMRFGKRIMLHTQQPLVFVFWDCENKNYTKCD